LNSEISEIMGVCAIKALTYFMAIVELSLIARWVVSPPLSEILASETTLASY
jgi:hypothetical protein